MVGWGLRGSAVCVDTQGHVAYSYRGTRRGRGEGGGREIDCRYVKWNVEEGEAQNEEVNKIKEERRRR